MATGFPTGLAATHLHRDFVEANLQRADALEQVWKHISSTTHTPAKQTYTAVYTTQRKSKRLRGSLAIKREENERLTTLVP